MRTLVNPVSIGMLIGLALTAIAICTALYASLWQAVSIGLFLLGLFTSISLYFGGCARCQRIESKSQTR